MNDHHSERLEHILRIVFVLILGGILMIVQRWLLFEKFFIPGSNEAENPQVFFNYVYNPSSLIVWLFSALAIILWYLTTLKIRDKFRPKDTRPTTLLWFSYAILPIMSIVISCILFINSSGDLLPALSSFLVFDGILIFWIGTAISTPGIMANVVPLSNIWRFLLRIKG